ncbi:MAG: DUF3575 domain-containing protein [Bacteroidales bacterium]|nr:DUF3575 domain-containing protein [Bacteroidales bacterium]
MLNLFKKRVLLLMLCLTAWCGQCLYAQKVAIKMDAAKASMWMPNLGAEFAIGDSYSFDVSVFGSNKIWNQDWKMFAVQPEFRWWISGRQMARFYVGVTAIAMHYNIDYSKYEHKGDLAGGGLTFGYSWYISPRWSVEAYGGFGAIAYKENRYKNRKIYEDYNPEKKEYGNASGCMLVPAKLGVSFSYILK